MDRFQSLLAWPTRPWHGALGIWDELIPILVAIVFTLVVLLIWQRSRGFAPELEKEQDGNIVSEDDQTHDYTAVDAESVQDNTP